MTTIEAIPTIVLPLPTLDLRELERLQPLCERLVCGVAVGDEGHIAIARQVLAHVDEVAGMIEERLSRRARVDSNVYDVVATIAGANDLASIMSVAVDRECDPIAAHELRIG